MVATQGVCLVSSFGGGFWCDGDDGGVYNISHGKRDGDRRRSTWVSRIGWSFCITPRHVPHNANDMIPTQYTNTHTHMCTEECCSMLLLPLLYMPATAAACQWRVIRLHHSADCRLGDVGEGAAHPAAIVALGFRDLRRRRHRFLFLPRVSACIASAVVVVLARADRHLGCRHPRQHAHSRWFQTSQRSCLVSTPPHQRSLATAASGPNWCQANMSPNHSNDSVVATREPSLYYRLSPDLCGASPPLAFQRPPRSRASIARDGASRLFGKTTRYAPIVRALRPRIDRCCGSHRGAVGSQYALATALVRLFSRHAAHDSG